MADPVATLEVPQPVVVKRRDAPAPASDPTRPAHPHPHPAGLLPSLQSLLYVLILTLFFMTFTVQPIRIPSASMEPTLLVGDFLLMDKQLVASGGPRLLPPSAIARGDIVVFHDPIDDPAIHLVKRVIGLPGDRLHLHDGVVFLNGQPLPEPYTIHRSAPPDPYRDDFPFLRVIDATVNPNWWIRLRTLVHQGEIIVPPAAYFVMGDNRNNSEDSRYWGFVPRDAIVGKPLVIYFSWRQPGTDELEDKFPTRTPHRTTIARWDRTFRVVH